MHSCGPHLCGRDMHCTTRGVTGVRLSDECPLHQLWRTLPSPGDHDTLSSSLTLPLTPGFPEPLVWSMTRASGMFWSPVFLKHSSTWEPLPGAQRCCASSCHLGVLGGFFSPHRAALVSHVAVHPFVYFHLACFLTVCSTPSLTSIVRSSLLHPPFAVFSSF